MHFLLLNMKDFHMLLINEGLAMVIIWISHKISIGGTVRWEPPPLVISAHLVALFTHVPVSLGIALLWLIMQF